MNTSLGHSLEGMRLEGAGDVAHVVEKSELSALNSEASSVAGGEGGRHFEWWWESWFFGC